MAVAHKETEVAEGPRYCPKCGFPSAGAQYCPECGAPLSSRATASEATAEMPQPVWRAPVVGAPAQPAGEGGRRRSRVLLIVAVSALILAGGAVLAIVLINKSSSSPTSGAVGYRAKLGSAIAPVVSANRALSSALQALDSSKKTIGAAQSATSQAQSAVTAARGAMGVLTVPSSDTSLSQQAQQALTEENGYLQALASTLVDPSGQSSTQLRPLITATQSSMVPLDPIAPGATSSLNGVDNVLGWVAAEGQAAQKKAPAKASSSASQTATPSSSPSGMTGCDQNISVNSSTSCQFADNVFYQYAQDVQQAGGPGSYYVYAYSPVTGQDYTDTCNYNPTDQIVLCSHGSDLIQFPYWAAEVYQPG